MKQSLNQKQKASLTLTPLLQKQIKLLTLNGQSIREEFNTLLDEYDDDEDTSFKHFRDELLIDQYRNFLRDSSNTNLRVERIEFQDLRSSLLEQFVLLNLRESDYLIGEYLIDSIEPEGRLDPEIDYDDIKLLIYDSFGKEISDPEIEKVLCKIQELEPEGCGYRTITESLTIQIQNLDLEEETKALAIKAIQNINLQKITLESLDTSIQNIIKGLNFSPGLKLESNDVSFIKPDLIALLKDNEWFVSLNDSYMPKALLERISNNLLESNSNKRVEVKSFLRGLERRQKTLLLVSEYLVKKQVDFLNNKSNLVPITLLEIAESLQISKSTVSRIVNLKYIQLPNKLISLSTLLQRKVNGRSGGIDTSPLELEKLLKKLISEEKRQNPRSDEKLRCILKESYSINIARRTIAKYREKINIPIARLRA
jgi:RNA polymerase sigma-54 factor